MEKKLNENTEEIVEQTDFDNDKTETASTENEHVESAAETVSFDNVNVVDKSKQKTDSAKSKNIWKGLGKLAIVVTVSACAGYGAGYIASQNHGINGDVTQFSENNMQNGPQFASPDENFSNAPSKPSDDSNQGSVDGNIDEFETSAALGITVSETDSGLIVMGFADNSKASDAGLQTGDIIVSLDGETYTSLIDLQDYILNKEIGDTVTIEVMRRGETGSVEVELVEKISSHDSTTYPDFNTDDSMKG